jgi:hypothetical protein
MLLCTKTAFAADTSAVDRNFASNLPTPGSVLSKRLWPLKDGGAVVEIARHPSVAGIYLDYYHIGPDGRLDPRVAQPVWTTGVYGAPPLPTQSVAVVLTDGSFVMSTPPYRRNALGAEITGFLPSFDLTQPIGPIAEQSDGKLLIAQGPRLVRLQPEGTLDPTFAADTSPLTAIRAIFLDGAQRLILFGDAGNNATRIIRLTTTGRIDASFAAIAPVSYPIAVTANSNVVESGGYPRYRADGSLDTEWDVRPWATRASAVAIAPSGEIYIAYSGLGVFRLTAGPTPRLDPNFFTLSDRSATIETMAVLPDGKLLVLGNFTSWEGFTTSNLVRLDPTRTLAATAPVAALDSRPPIHAGARIVVQGRAVGSGPLTFTWSSLDEACCLPTFIRRCWCSIRFNARTLATTNYR